MKAKRGYRLYTLAGGIDECNKWNYHLPVINNVNRFYQMTIAMHKKLWKPTRFHAKLLLTAIVTFVCIAQVSAQGKNQMVRLAKVKVVMGQLESYKIALKEQMTEAIKVEPGVLTYYAVSEKKDESSITILEIYKDTAAYNAHILTPHFKKYKDRVKDMVKSLELVDVNLIAVARKPEE